MSNPFTEIYGGVKSLFIGMRITLGQFFKPGVTVHYPHETLKMPKRFRGHIELVRDPESGKPKCFVCKLCEKACPSDCITVEGIKPEGARRKTVTQYRLDFTKCSLCGSCVEACHDSAIRFSRDYNLAGTNKEDFIMDLFKRLEDEAGTDVQASSSKVQSPQTRAAGPQNTPHTQPAANPAQAAPAAAMPAKTAEPVKTDGAQAESPATAQPKAEPAKAAALSVEAK